VTAVLDQLALAITAVGVVAAAVALASSGSWRAAIGVLAELLTAAGLVRLSAEPSWNRLAAAALILVVWRLILSTLLRAPSSRTQSSRAR
jgi:hypothetical protein